MVATVIGAAGLGGCFDPTVREGIACGPNRECPPGQRCDETTLSCQVEPGQAGGTDAAPMCMTAEECAIIDAGGGNGADAGLSVSFATGLPYPTGGMCRELAYADVTGDTVPDLVALNGLGTDTFLTVHAGQSGSGNFDLPTTFPLEGSVQTFVLSSIDSDGRFDIVTIGVESARWYESTDVPGTFESPVNLWDTTNMLASHLVFADVTSDGSADGVFVGADAAMMGGVFVARRTAAPTPTFEPAVSIGPLAGVSNTSRIAVADLNADLRNDIVVAAGGRALHMQQSPSPLTFSPAEDLASAQNAVAIGDVNGDSHMDVVTGDGILLGTPGEFMTQIPYPDSFRGLAVAIADIDGTGPPEVVVVDFDIQNAIAVFKMVDNMPTLIGSIPIDHQPSALVVGRFDPGDSRDIAICSAIEQKLTVFLQRP